MSTVPVRRSPLEIVRALREAKQRGAIPLDLAACREALSEALEPRQLLTVTGASITPPTGLYNGASFEFLQSATTNHDPTSTSWSLYFGDGTSAATDSISGSGSIGHTYAVPGTYSAVGIVSDGSTTSSGPVYYDCSTTVTVADAPLSPYTYGASTSFIYATQAITYSGTIAHFADANPSEIAASLSATVDFGDGAGAVAASVVADAGGGFDVLSPHAFNSAGSFSGTVAISEHYGASLTMYVNSSVVPWSLTVSPGTGTFTAGESKAVTAATFVDQNTAEPASSLTAEIYWGDGTSASGTVVSDGGGNFEVHGTQNYAAAGTFTGLVKVWNYNGTTASSSYTGTVAAPTVTIQASTVGVGTTQDIEVDVAGNFTASDPITLSGYNGSLISVSSTSFSWNATSEVAHYLVTGLAVGTTAITAAVPAAVPVAGAATVVPDRMFVTPTSLTMCCVGEGNTLSPIIIVLSTGAVGAGIAPPPRTIDVTTSNDVNVPATITTGANGGATLVITPIAGDGGVLFNGEATVVTLTDTGAGTPSANIIVNFVLPTLTIANTALYLPAGGQATTSITLTDPTNGFGIQGVPLTFVATSSDPANPTTATGVGGDTTGTNANNLPGVVNVIFFAADTAAPGDTCTLTVTVTGINGSLLSVTCVATVVTYA